MDALIFGSYTGQILTEKAGPDIQWLNHSIQLPVVSDFTVAPPADFMYMFAILINLTADFS